MKKIIGYDLYDDGNGPYFVPVIDEHPEMLFKRPRILAFLKTISKGDLSNETHNVSKD